MWVPSCLIVLATVPLGTADALVFLAMSHLLPLELGRADLLVGVTGPPQLLVRSLAHDAAGVQHENEVCVADGRDALRDDDLSDAWKFRREGVAEPSIGRKVES